MALSEFERKRVELASEPFLEKRRPEESIRDKVDIAVRLEGQDVTIVEMHPNWKNSSEIAELPVAKATYIQTRKKWRIFWMRADMKWHGYEPYPDARTIEEFFEVVDSDPHGTFWG